MGASDRAGVEGTRGVHHRLRGLGALGHPVAVVALVLLIANDTVLKAAVPGIVTGKLSDVAGLVVLPLVVATAVATVVRDDHTPIRVSAVVVGGWFTAMKTVPAVAAATEALAELVVPHARIVVDPTDLLALPAVGLAVWTWRRRLPPGTWSIPVLVVASTWSMATSYEGPVAMNEVLVADDGSFLVTGEADVLAFDAAGRQLHAIPTRDHRQVRDRLLEVCLVNGTCVRGEGHDLVEVAPDGSHRLAVDIPEYRSAFASHGGGGPMIGVQDVAANDDGVVVVAHGTHGVSVRSEGGTWTRVPLQHQIRLTGPEVPPHMHTGVLGLVLLAFLLATWPASNWQKLLAGCGIIAAAVAIFLSWLPDASFLLLLAFPAAAFAIVAAVPMLLRGGPTGAHLRRVGLAFVWVAVAAEAIMWAWARGWIAHLEVAGGLAVVMALGVAIATIVRAFDEGLWPTPRAIRPPPPTFGGPS